RIANDAWKELMVDSPRTERVAQASILQRGKRADNVICNCMENPSICPVGNPGPMGNPGEPGLDGTDGEPGIPGQHQMLILYRRP
ncbi:hypothetical protein TELCIR_24798, partial [Teladorsagia circumcincta]